MSDSDGKSRPTFADPLLGEPVGEAIARDAVDGLEMSAKREKRPTGVSRQQYLESMPGENTANFLLQAGIKRRAKRRWLLVVLVGLGIGLGVVAVLWWLQHT